MTSRSSTEPPSSRQQRRHVILQRSRKHSHTSAATPPVIDLTADDDDDDDSAMRSNHQTHITNASSRHQSSPERISLYDPNRGEYPSAHHIRTSTGASNGSSNRSRPWHPTTSSHLHTSSSSLLPPDFFSSSSSLPTLPSAHSTSDASQMRGSSATVGLSQEGSNGGSRLRVGLRPHEQFSSHHRGSTTTSTNGNSTRETLSFELPFTTPPSPNPRSERSSLDGTWNFSDYSTTTSTARNYLDIFSDFSPLENTSAHTASSYIASPSDTAGFFDNLFSNADESEHDSSGDSLATTTSSMSTTSTRIPTSSRETHSTRRKKRKRQEPTSSSRVRRTPSINRSLVDLTSISDNPKSEKKTTTTSEKNESEDDNCAICMDNITNRTYLDGCSHTFCWDCIKKWSDSSTVCPMCRARFRSLKKKQRNGKKARKISVPRRDLRTQNTTTFEDLQNLLGLNGANDGARLQQLLFANRRSRTIFGFQLPWLHTSEPRNHGTLDSARQGTNIGINIVHSGRRFHSRSGIRRRRRTNNGSSSSSSSNNATPTVIDLTSDD